MEGEAPATRVDRWGHPVSIRSDACLAAVDSYYDQALIHGRDRAVILRALLHEPVSVLANALAAYVLSKKNPSKAASLLATAAASLESATHYERTLFGAICCLVGVNRDANAALQRHFELLKEYPRDMVSLKRAQILCFYMGRADLSLKLVEQVLPQNQDQSYIYGMLAFPLLELGRLAEAEGAARKGFDINKLDFWSQHNICHVLQYECRFKEAVDFMKTCSSFWSSCSAFMYTHNWWHVAVCYLEGHAPLQNVLEVYDQYIWKELQRRDTDNGEVYVNALGLLLRFYVRGQGGCVEDRLMALVNMFKDESSWNVEWLLDLLGLWALVNSNEISKADALLKSMKSRVSSMSKEKQRSMQRAILLAEATYEYGKRNYQKVFDILGPDFDAMDYKMIGASDEQIDVFNEIWYDVLLNSGNVSKAIEVIEKQVEKREGVPFSWRLLEKAYFMEGREDAASAAGEKAKALEHAYFG